MTPRIVQAIMYPVLPTNFLEGYSIPDTEAAVQRQ